MRCSGQRPWGNASRAINLSIGLEEILRLGDTPGARSLIFYSHNDEGLPN
jgi:hypothetical protein